MKRLTCRLDALVSVGARSKLGRVVAALGLVVAGVVFAGENTVVAAGFTGPPERLYMLPENPLAPIPAAIVALAVPVDVLRFDGSKDLISQDDREIVLDFVDTPNTPNPPGPCNIVDDPDPGDADYSIDPCTRIQMRVFFGTLKVGNLTEVFKDNPDGTASTDQANAVYLTASGARVDLATDADYNADDGVPTLNLNGTEQQLNDALELLEYRPQDDYHYDGSNPETLEMLLVPDDGSGSIDWDVDIRVLDVNDWPELDGARELGDTGGDGPATQNADPGIEKVIPGTYSLTDVDNDDRIDTYGPDGQLGGGDDVADPDGNDGAGEDMLLIGFLDCGGSVAPDTGFHFASAAYESAGDTIESALNFALGIPAVAPVSPPEAIAAYDNKVLAREAFVAGLSQTGLTDTTLQSAGAVDYGEFFVGVSTIDEIQAALADIYFLHEVENDSCELLVIVSDLGNNGLPLQFFGQPDAREYGVEAPFFGFDWDEFTINTGEFLEIDASFDPATTLYVNEDATAVAPITITSDTDPTHPGFDLRWSAVGGVLPGQATPGDDFQGITDATLGIADDASSASIDTNAFNDSVPEGNETFTFVLTVPTAAPPGSFTRPAGYEVVSTVSQRTVVIIDDDDPPRQVISVSDPAVAEGDSGTKNLTFTLGLNGAADGNETVQVDTSSVAPSVGGVDYTEIVGQTVAFAPGATSATVNVVVNGDTMIEADELVNLIVSNPSSNVTLGGDTTGNGTITNDDVPPTVTINQGATQGDPTNGASIVFDVVFDKVVTGFDDGATDVTLSGTAGGTLSAAISGSGTTYTVTVSGMTSSGAVIADVPSGAANDAALRDNVVSTSLDNEVTYDNVGPMVTIDQAGGQVDPTGVSPILFTVVFSEAVTGFATGDVTLSGSAGATTAVVSGSGTTYTVSVSGMTGDGDVIADVAAGVARDVADNQNLASTSTDNTVAFEFPDGDVTPPSVTIDQGAAQVDPTNVASIVFDVVFTEPVSGFGDSAGDVTLSGTAGGTLSAAVSGGGTTYTVTVTGMTSSGTVIAGVPAAAATDAALLGNVPSTSTDNTVTFEVPDGDSTSPTVTIDQAGGQVDPTGVSPILFTVVFDEAVTGFATGDVTLSGTAGATTAEVSGSGTTYTVTVTGMTTSGTVIADVPAGVAVDAASNPNVASTSTDNTVIFEVPDGDPNDSSSTSSTSSSTSSTSSSTSSTSSTVAPASTSATVPNQGATTATTFDPRTGNAAPIPSIDPSGELPETGSDLTEVLVAAAAAIACGAVLLVARRRLT